MTVSEGRRMHTKSLRRNINLLKGRPNINITTVEWTDSTKLGSKISYHLYL